ncbi:hypothetical protein P6144_11005 [Sphingomonas sp. HITSZ_GF]|uniref:hypothetical protein n=1 Tax=Sphingomonas sp. HITSZ_GF TaxID=3037247 RepID=UPI00240E6333|nr:hypothetical protein [Sphingomonas sp. HITSZ_GF]MDG2534179.1 hypothetical protein [Sphingomonas sp. HITSZ_GF]
MENAPVMDFAELSPDQTDALMQVVGAPVPVPAAERFVAREHFVVGHDGALPISLLGDDFLTHFLPLVEEDVAASTLYQRVLVKSTIDAPIFLALGGEDAASVPLAHLFAFLKTADRGKWYFLYVRDVASQLWAIDTYWRDGGWDMEAYSVTYPRGWRGGGHVVSR